MNMSDLYYRRFGRNNSCNVGSKEAEAEMRTLETTFFDHIRSGEAEAILEMAKEQPKPSQLSQNWDLIKRCAKEVMAGSDNKEVLK